MNVLVRFRWFIGIALVLSLGLFASIAAMLGIAATQKLTLLMVLPFMWWTRIFLAIGTGRITRRFVFVNAANISTVLSLANPDQLERKNGAWDFYGYAAR